jgi:hypothetical protein
MPTFVTSRIRVRVGTIKKEVSCNKVVNEVLFTRYALLLHASPARSWNSIVLTNSQDL